jgi:hypothetical protein
LSSVDYPVNSSPASKFIVKPPSKVLRSGKFVFGVGKKANLC